MDQANLDEDTAVESFIPEFDTSEEMLTALRRLKREKSNLYNKLISNKPEYVQLRAELFPTGENLNNV